MLLAFFFFFQSFTCTVVEIMVSHQLKLIEIWQLLPIKKVTENHSLTDRFVIFYHSNKDWPIMFYFFKELQVFLSLLILFFFLVFLFMKEWIQWLVFFLFLLIPFLYFMSFFIKEWIQWLVFQLVRLQFIRLLIL